MTFSAMDFTYGTPFHNHTQARCRANGRIGSLRYARNCKLRRIPQASDTADAVPRPRLEAAHEASKKLDLRFQWRREARR